MFGIDSAIQRPQKPFVINAHAARNNIVHLFTQSGKMKPAACPSFDCRNIATSPPHDHYIMIIILNTQDTKVSLCSNASVI